MFNVEIDRADYKAENRTFVLEVSGITHGRTLQQAEILSKILTSPERRVVAKTEIDGQGHLRFNLLVTVPEEAVFPSRNVEAPVLVPATAVEIKQEDGDGLELSPVQEQLRQDNLVTLVPMPEVSKEDIDALNEAFAEAYMPGAQPIFDDETGYINHPDGTLEPTDAHEDIT